MKLDCRRRNADRSNAERRKPTTTAAMSADVPFIEYDGRIVAIAGRTRCFFVDDLDAAALNFVAGSAGRVRDSIDHR
jgi:hypothetical protein